MKEEKIKSYSSGHRQRVKEKFSQTGFLGWQEYEILEFALFFAMPQRDTKDLAKRLIDAFGSLKQVIDADENKLIEIGKLGGHCAVFIQFLRKFCAMYSQLKIKSAKSISSSQEAINYLSTTLSGEKVEKFYILILNSASKVTDCIEIESGTVNTSAIIPRKIAETALKSQAVSIIIAHNHPGGTLKPSQNDINATEAVKKALNAIEISLLDHIIIAGNDHFSFKEYNLI
jgi:DNA repair protein RadC